MLRITHTAFSGKQTYVGYFWFVGKSIMYDLEVASCEAYYFREHSPICDQIVEAVLIQDQGPVIIEELVHGNWIPFKFNELIHNLRSL